MEFDVQWVHDPSLVDVRRRYFTAGLPNSKCHLEVLPLGLVFPPLLYNGFVPVLVAQRVSNASLAPPRWGWRARC